MWACPKCGERVADGIETCWICGTSPDGTEDPDFAPEAMPAAAGEPAHASVEATPELPDPDAKTRRELWIEVAVAVVVVVLPDLWFAIHSLVATPPPVSYAIECTYVTLRSLVVSVLVLYLIWRSGEPWRTWGIAPVRASDFALGVGVLVGVVAVGGVVQEVVWSVLPASLRERIAGQAFEWPQPVHAGDWFLCVVTNLTNGFAEEISIRAYLLLRLRQLLRSTPRALALSALLFASYHLYQGVWAASSVFVHGVLMGLAFLWIRRLWPVVLAHALHNIALAVSGAVFS